MEFPVEITLIVSQYAWAWRAPLRPNWREGSSIIKHLIANRWWMDYVYDRSIVFDEDMSDTWVEWCRYKLLIGPPRMRSERELCGFDEEYMTREDVDRHFLPWVMTWPEPGDHSWCKVRGVPEWAKEEYLAAN